MANWTIKKNTNNIKLLARLSDTSELIAYLLSNRGIADPEDIKSFIGASVLDLHNPKLMKDLDRGIEIIIQAIKDRKRICVFGDYDVDGVISTVILFKALRKCNADVTYYIPDREAEGYGMNKDRISILKEEGCDVILTCDNGIAAIEEIAHAKKLGMTVVITDHHDVQYIENQNIRTYLLPNADAIVDPKQEDCQYPFKLLCGGGITFKFAQLLYEKLEIHKSEAMKFIEYAGIATICDMVELAGENRIIARNALEMLNTTKNIGLRALIREAGIEGKKINSYHIGYIIGPCINATGRLDTASLSVELLLTEDEERAVELAKKLRQLNAERQEMTARSVTEICEVVDGSELKNDRVLLVYNENVHESIAGIIAGRVRERYNTPTIVIAKGKEMPKGSGRSIEKYNIFEEIMKCKELLYKYGGHPMAVGISLLEENIEELRRRMNENCCLTDEDMIHKIKIDMQLPLNRISYRMIEELEVLEPFGKGNPSPLFAEKSVEILKAFVLGKEKNVLKLYCRTNGNSEKVEAISFDGMNKFRELVAEKYGTKKLEDILNGASVNIKLDMIFVPTINVYNGNKSIQLNIKDFRLAN